MSRKMLSQVDFKGYQSLNQRIENKDASPSAFGAGHIYFDTTLDQLQVYDGAQWLFGSTNVVDLNSANADIGVGSTGGTYTLTLNSSTSASNDTIAKRDGSGNLYATNLSGSASGVNTGDQTISLSSEASGSGTGTISVTLSNSAVIGKVLTGFTGATGGNVTASDSILTAIQRLEYRTALNDAKLGTSVLTANRAMVTDGAGLPAASTTTDTEIGYVNGVTGAIQTQLNGKEATISSGTTGQYWRGDKSFQTLDTLAVAENTNLYFREDRVRATVLTGFTGATGSVSSSDSVLLGIEKLQSQVDVLQGVTHSQNTDLGTTSDTFYLGGPTGPKVKQLAGAFQLINNADTGFADLRVGNMTVDGTLTQTNSNVVNIGDSQITLNADIATFAANSNGGIAVKRLAADNTTRRDGELNFDIASSRWVSVFGPTTAGPITRPVALRFDAALGDGTNTAFTVTHDLGTKYLVIAVQDATTGEVVDCDITGTTTTQATIAFYEAPASNAYRVTIVG